MTCDTWKGVPGHPPTPPASLPLDPSPQHKERKYRTIGGRLRSRQQHKAESTESAGPGTDGLPVDLIYGVCGQWTPPPGTGLWPPFPSQGELMASLQPLCGSSGGHNGPLGTLAKCRPTSPMNPHPAICAHPGSRSRLHGKYLCKE